MENRCQEPMMSSTHVQAILQTVWQNTGAQSVMLVSLDGRIIDEVGSFSNIDKGTLGALLGHGMAAFYEISSLSEESEIEKAFFYYQGTTLEFACTSINEHYFLAAVYTSGSETPQASLGLIWHYSKQACEQLQHITVEVPETGESASPVLYEDDLSVNVDNLFDFLE